MKVIRKRLDAVQTRAPFTRWSDICLCVEISFDNGETWVESPENDPRTGLGFRAPPLTGDAKCDAAARMVAVIEDQVDAAIDAATAVGLATALLAIVTAFVPGMNILVTIFVAVASALIAFGSAALAADFTEENYDKLICIFADNIDTNGQVSTAQLDAILADIAAEFGVSVIHPVCELLFSVMGTNGFSNAAALKTETGDCSGCEWCWIDDFTEGEQGYSTFGTGTWTADGWQTGLVYVGGDPARGRNQVQLTKSFGFTVNATRIEMVYDAVIGINDAPTGTGMWTDTFSTVVQAASAANGLNTIERGTAISITNIQMSLGAGGCDGCGNPGGIGVIKYIKYYGLDECPFGDPNC